MRGYPEASKEDERVSKVERTAVGKGARKGWLSRWLGYCAVTQTKTTQPTNPLSRLRVPAAKKSPLTALGCASAGGMNARYLSAKHINLDSRRQET